MSFLGIGLAYLGYGLMFWGSTLLVGGPGNTGAWPLMYALFGIGTGPKTAKPASATPGTPTGDQARFQAGGDASTSAGSRSVGGPF